MAETLYEEGGKYLPLQVWSTKGFDASRIEQGSKPGDIQEHPLLGLTYRVALLARGTRGSQGYKTKDKHGMKGQAEAAAEAAATNPGRLAAEVIPASTDFDKKFGSDSSSSSSTSSSTPPKKKKSKRSKKDKKKKYKKSKDKKAKKEEDMTKAELREHKKAEAAELRAVETEKKKVTDFAQTVVNKISTALVAMEMLETNHHFKDLLAQVAQKFGEIAGKLKKLSEESGDAIKTVDASKISLSHARETGPILAEFRKAEALVKSVYATCTRATS